MTAVKQAACSKRQSSDIKRPVAQMSSGPRYDACNGASLASGADLHASERYDGAQPCSDLNISVASLRSTRRRTCKSKGRPKGLDTCYSAAYMSQTRDQKLFTISEVAADWREPMVLQRIMWPTDNWTHGAARRHTVVLISHIGPSPLAVATTLPLDHCTYYECNACRTGEMCSRRPVCVINLAVAFCTDCSR